MNKYGFRFLLLGLVAITALAGCASEPKRKGGLFSQLNGSAPDALFATDMPVESAEEAISRADQEAAAGKTDHALYHYIRALEFDDKNADTFYKIGLIHLSRNDPQRAELAFRYALQVNPEHAGARANLGLILLRRREYAAARTLLEGAVQKDPSLWQAQDALGTLADLRQDFPAAKAHYEAALRLNPQSAQVLNNYGYSRYLMGDWEEAEAHYRRAIQLDPQFHLAWQNLGQLQVRRGDYEGAVDTFSHVLRKEQAFNNVGYICMVDGKYALAETYFGRAMEASPSYYEIAEKNLERLKRIEAERAALKQSSRGPDGMPH